MYFIYRPEGEPVQEWWFDPRKLRAREAEAIEKRTGWDWTEFGTHLMQGSSLARRALLWTYQRRVHPTLRFDDVDFSMDEVELEFSRQELREVRKGMADSGATADELARLDAEMETARDGPGKAPPSTAA